MGNNAVAEDVSRIIGRIEGRLPGPTIVAFGGMHGNEPAGVEALEKVIEALKPTHSHFRGRFLALRGNLAALERGVRFIDEDMNRIWFPAIIKKIRETPMAELESSERRELKKILPVLDTFLSASSADTTVIADLHSFSAEGEMFAITAHKEEAINFFCHLPVPLVFGVEKILLGAALRYYQDKGHISLAIEGGQHQNPLTVQNNTAAMLTLLEETGCMDSTANSGREEYEEYKEHLKDQNRQLPPQVDLVYRHRVAEEDHFAMRPGFKNFQPIKKGKWLADDRDGRIIAQYDGYVLMPLYQPQGSDGFFIVQEHERA